MKCKDRISVSDSQQWTNITIKAKNNIHLKSGQTGGLQLKPKFYCYNIFFILIFAKIC